MRSHSEIVDSLIRPGVVAVIRTPKPEPIPALCAALVAGGVTALEITMTTPGALDLLPALSRQFSGQAVVGVGSITSMRICRAALEAGAEFVVSPVLKPELIEVAHSQNRVAIIGAYTPTEAQAAYEGGADFIKIFPADGLGPGYVKSIRAALPHLRIIPTGGVDLDNAAEFLSAGCVALGVGSSLITPEILRHEKWAELTQLAARFVEIAKKLVH